MSYRVHAYAYAYLSRPREDTLLSPSLLRIAITSLLFCPWDFGRLWDEHVFTSVGVQKLGPGHLSCWDSAFVAMLRSSVLIVSVAGILHLSLALSPLPPNITTHHASISELSFGNTTHHCWDHRRNTSPYTLPQPPNDQKMKIAYHTTRQLRYLPLY